jgi:hypothetical protein
MVRAANKPVRAQSRLFFPRHDRVDGMWATIAQSVANGPLKAAGVDLVKVAPSPRYVREGEEVSRGYFPKLSSALPCHLRVHGQRLRQSGSDQGESEWPAIVWCSDRL